ncbi:class I SAM-dependent methyltransferase [Pleionea mediterranea]|uniref:Methyltransferase family protein n=1 Tax=Pleionea mediterranea TaxID=523701 RepID=A0A316G0R9_9GAMM|nr:class I SAM-dependent methyltransferase [Pleionea mediterranea]PWK54398.1 methyltransferase family protein [Pleionea mediterranea]
MNQENFKKKYTESGMIGQYLIRSFYQAVGSVTQPENNNEILEVGCGHGYSTSNIQAFYPDSKIKACDIDNGLLKDAKSRCPDVEFINSSIYNLPFKNNAFKTVFCLEVLEHLEFPDLALKELKRVSSNYLICSVPREPLWCVLNLCRLKYASKLGNTPGHINHWSSYGFKKLLGTYGKVVCVKQPIPWTVILLDVSSTK